jgi:flagellar FliJ protein
MATRFPLQTVLDLMQVRAEDAARDLGRLIAAEQDARTRLTLLETYRDEYAAKFREAAARGLTPQQWANYQEFTARIELAITQQTAAVDASRSHTAAGQERWRHQNHRVQAFDTLAQKHDAEQRYLDGRREQKQVDELVTRRHQTSGDAPD